MPPGPGSERLLSRARTMWESLAGVHVAFTPAVRVALSPESRLCPPGWVGIVVIAGAAIATAPDARTVQTVQRSIGDVPPVLLTDRELLQTRCEIIEVLGPAALAYLDPAEFHPLHSSAVIHPQDEEMRQYLAAAVAEDVAESGLTEITSPAFGIRQRGRIVAAAGYRRWPGRVAQLSVLTAPGARNRGLGRLVASAAVESALRDGLLPQWRARPEASRRVAQAVGFRELGSQISIHLRAGTPAL